MGLTIGSLFSGIGGLDLAVEAVTGGRVVWQCERDPYCRRVLARHWPDAPIFEDVETLTDPPRVDVLAGGFPCQDISSAGKQAGIEHGKKSGLWREFARIVRVVRPRFIYLENVSAITLPGRGLDLVLGDLAQVGINAEWACFRASDVGAPHGRDRWFLFGWMADADGLGFNGDPKFTQTEKEREDLFPDFDAGGETMADTGGERFGNTGERVRDETQHAQNKLPGFDSIFSHRWPPGAGDVDGWRDWIRDGLCSPVVRRGPHGFPEGLDVRPRLHALGNAVCPQQGAEAYRQLMARAGFGKVTT